MSPSHASCSAVPTCPNGPQETHAAPVINEYWEKAEFPHELRSKLGDLGIGGAHVKTHGCRGLTTMGAAAAIVELGRVDGSLSTFFLVHSYLGVMTLDLLGSEAQKAELLPGLADFSKVAAWALTEPSNGSDASALTTTARKVPGGWVLDGRKRWIGNGERVEGKDSRLCLSVNGSWLEGMTPV